MHKGYKIVYMNKYKDIQIANNSTVNVMLFHELVL